MNETGLRTRGRPRTRFEGYDPTIGGRVPAALADRLRDMAAARNVTVTVILREALESYAWGYEGRGRAA